MTVLGPPSYLQSLEARASLRIQPRDCSWDVFIMGGGLLGDSFKPFARTAPLWRF